MALKYVLCWTLRKPIQQEVLLRSCEHILSRLLLPKRQIPGFNGSLKFEFLVYMAKLRASNTP